MKIRNTSRIIAFALALVMIVPLISVPTFAADATAQNAAASTLYSQDFEKQGLETSDVTVDKINGTSIVAAADTKHGNVYQLSSKIPEELKNVYYLYVDGKYTKLEDVAPDADGKITVTQGEQTIVGVVNTDGFSTKAEIDGATATNNTYIVNGQMYAAREGMNPIVTPNYLATPDYKTDRLAFSVDYYFGAGYGAESDMRLSGDNGKAIDLLSFVPNTTNGTVTIRVHSGACNTSGNSGYIVYPYNDGYQLHGAWTTGAKTINANTWVNVKIIVDFTTGSFAIYLDDVLWQIRQEYTWRTNAYTSTGMKGNSWNFIQINRGKNPSVYNAENSYIQVDNIAIYDDAEISKLGLFNGLNENFESYTVGNNYASTGYYANSAAGYTIQNGTASNTSKVWDIGNASGSYDKGWTINHEILSSVVTPELVFEADYFIGKNSTGVELTSEFVLSFYNVDGSAAVSRTAFMSPFTISYGANATTATLKANAQNSVTNSSTVLPVDEWFTLSVAVNMRTGYFEIYVNGDLAQSARLYRGGYATGFTVMPGSWSAGKHKVSGGYSGELQIDNMKIYEGSVPTNYVANAYAEDYTGDTTVTGTNAVIENDTAKIVNHYNDAVKAQNPGYVYGADNKVVLSAKYNINNLSNQASHLTSQFGGSYRTADGTLKSSSYIGLYMIWCDANENTTYTNGYARLQISGSNATYYIKEGQGNQCNVPTTGEWFTITAVIDLETGFFTLYVDGVAIASATISVGTHLSINPNSWIVSKYQSHHYAVNEEGKYVDADGNVFEDQTKRYELTYEDNCYVDDVCTYVLNGTNGTEVTVDIDADKDLQYVGAKINGEDVVTLSPKFFKAADDATFAAAAVYFNAEGEYNGIVSKPTDGTTSVRYGEPTGLRFKTTINEALVAELQAMVADGTLKAVEMGTLIAPEAWAADTAALKNLKAYTSEEYKALADDKKPAVGTYSLKVVTNKYYEKNTIVGSIVNILDTNYETNFAAAGYVKVTLLSGETVVIVAADATVDNVKAVAQRVIDSGYNGAQLDTLLGFGATVAE